MDSINDAQNGITEDKDFNGIIFPDAPNLKPQAISAEPVTEDNLQDEDKKSLIEQLKYQTLADGSVQYKNPADQLYFTDHGRYIELDKAVEMDREAIVAMLKLAQEKFGGNIELTGTAEFKEQAIRIMLEEGLKIKLKHPEQYALKEQMQRDLAQSKSKEPPAPPALKNGLVDATDKPDSSVANIVADDGSRKINQRFSIEHSENTTVYHNLTDAMVAFKANSDPLGNHNLVILDDQDKVKQRLITNDWIHDSSTHVHVYAFPEIKAYHTSLYDPHKGTKPSEAERLALAEKATAVVQQFHVVPSSSTIEMPPVALAVRDVDDLPVIKKGVPAQEDEILIGEFAYSRARVLEDSQYAGPFNAQHIKDTHQFLFQDTTTYQPGVIRSDAETWVARRKLPSTQEAYLVHYAPSSQIDSRLNDVFEKFNIEQLKGMNQQDAAKAIAKLYADLDYIHPFHEGNSRSIRIVTQQIAQQAGFTIDWQQTNQNNDSRDNLYKARDSQVLRRAFDNGGIQSESDLKAASRTLHKLQTEASLEQVMSQIVIPTADMKQRQELQITEPKQAQFDSGYKDKASEIDYGMMEHMVEKQLKQAQSVERPVATLIIAPPGEYREELKEKVDSELKNNTVYANHAAFKDTPYYPVVKEHPAAWAKALATGAMSEKKNMVFHGNYNDSENLERAVRKLKRAGYRVEIKAIPVHQLVSAVQEQTHAIKLWMPPYSKEQLASRQKNMADTITHLQSVKGLVDKIEIVDPLNKSSISSEYDASRDQWGKERAVVGEIINQLQHRPLTDTEIVALENKIDKAVIGARLVHSPQSGNGVVALQHLRSDIEQLERNQDAQKERYKHNDQPSPKPPTV